MNSWSLESELQGLTNTADINSALAALDLPADQIHSSSLQIDVDWTRGGAETYILIFSVIMTNLRRRFVMKSCVAWGAGSVAEIFSTWLERRLILSEAGIAVPRLYCHDRATAVEEFIEYDLRELLRTTDSRDQLLWAAGRNAALLATLGFLPLSLKDLRSRGKDVVVVDFGQDLGPPHRTASDTGISVLSCLIDDLSSDLDLTPEDLQSVEAGYGASKKK